MLKGKEAGFFKELAAMPEDAKDAEDGSSSVLDYSIPEYAYQYNLDSRNALVLELELHSDIAQTFNNLCKYVTHRDVNNPVVEIEQFLIFLIGKENVSAIQKQTFIGPVHSLIESVQETKLGIIEILNKNERGEPTTIVLKERVSDEVRHYEILLELVEENVFEVERKEASFFNLQALTKKTNIAKDAIEACCIFENLRELSQERLTGHSRQKNKFLVIQINDKVGNVVVPTFRVEKFALLLFDLVVGYYSDEFNENLRTIMLKKYRDSNIHAETVKSNLSVMQLDSSLFLYFIQLFANIMESLHEKFTERNMHNYEVINQYICSKILLRISISLRESHRDEQVREEGQRKIYDLIIKEMISSYQGKNNRKIFFPLSVSNFQEIEYVSTLSNRKAKKKLSEIYNVEGLKKLIVKFSIKTESIPDVLIFVSLGVTYYVHRFRLISSFFSVLSYERESIEKNIIQTWSLNSLKLPGKEQNKEFDSLIEQSYVSNMFRNYYYVTIKFLQGQGGGSLQAVNRKDLLKRLFFDEHDKFQYGKIAKDIVFDKKEDFKNKKKTLQAFLETLFDLDSVTPKTLAMVLDLSFFDLRKRAKQNMSSGLLGKTYLFITEIFSSLFLFFNPSKEYFSFISKRYYVIEKKKNLGNSESKDDYNEIPSSQSHKKPKSASSKGKKPIDLENEADKKKVQEKETRKKSKKKLLEKIPELRDPKKLKKILDEELESWNLKIGKPRGELTDIVDSGIAKLLERFDEDAFSLENIDHFYSIIASNNSVIGSLSNQDSLKRYIFYKSAQLRYKDIEVS